MRKILLLLLIVLLFLATSAYGQIPGTPNASGVIVAGPPWATGLPQGDGEMKLQLGYIDDKVNVNSTNANTDSARIDVNEAAIAINSTQLQDSLRWKNVISFGAIPNDGLSDSAAFNDCLAVAVADSGTMFIPEGNYKVPFFGITTVGGKVKIISDNAVIDATSATGNYVIDIRGTLSDTDALDASPSKSDTVITSSLASSLSRGDLVLIKSSVEWHKAATVGNQVKSEIVEVNGIDGTDIWLKAPLFDDYDADSCELYKCNFPQVTVRGIEFIGSGNRTGLYVYGGRDIDISHNRFTGPEVASISTQYIYQGSIDHNNTTDTRLTTNGYGVSVGLLQYVNIHDNFLNNARHGIVVGGVGISRMVNITNNHCGLDPEYEKWAIDLHPSAEYINITDNTCMGGGILTNCDRVTIKGNQIFAKHGKGIVAQLYGARGDSILDYINIYDNTIQNYNTDQQSIQIDFMAANVWIDKINIDRNDILCNTASGFNIASNSNANSVVNILELTNNRINVTSSGGALNFGDADLLPKHLIIRGNEFKGSATNLVYYGAADSATVVDSVQAIYFENNIVECTGTGNYVVQFLAGNNIYFRNNIIESVLGNSYRNRFNNEGHVDIIGNTFRNFTNSSALYLTDGPATAYLYDNTYINCAGSVEVTNVVWSPPADESW